MKKQVVSTLLPPIGHILLITHETMLQLLSQTFFFFALHTNIVVYNFCPW